MSLLALNGLSVELGERDVLFDISLTIEPSEVVGLIGPNGAGKTTLMRAALGLIAATGQCSLARLSAMERSKAVAWMPQERPIAWPIPVESLVMLGRMPHRGMGVVASDHDRQCVAEAIAQVGLRGFEQRPATQLSAGERTRALIARALAQQTPLIIADEPIAGLDPAHQISTMQTFAALADEGRAVFLSIHDLGLAARHCTRLVLLGEGGVVADGAPADVLTAEHLARIFNIEAFFAATEHGPVYQSLRVIEP
ncbi:MAG: ABC transporter ATP-binding protein [Spiribacter sp.]|jgi:iron complex transport system ATP-binding protein|nr:ABC transporter ATP-binding protein [Spiribacter sp.]